MQPVSKSTSCIINVPRTRIELALRNRNMALNHARLPIPPPGQVGHKITNFNLFTNFMLSFTILFNFRYVVNVKFI